MLKIKSVYFRWLQQPKDPQKWRHVNSCVHLGSQVSCSPTPPTWHLLLRPAGPLRALNSADTLEINFKPAGDEAASAGGGVTRPTEPWAGRAVHLAAAAAAEEGGFRGEKAEARGQKQVGNSLKRRIPVCLSPRTAVIGGSSSGARPGQSAGGAVTGGFSLAGFLFKEAGVNVKQRGRK